jgi:hypothetical protein
MPLGAGVAAPGAGVCRQVTDRRKQTLKKASNDRKENTHRSTQIHLVTALPFGSANLLLLRLVISTGASSKLLIIRVP